MLFILSTRIKNLRRHIGIPNPLYQIILCSYIEKNWKEIKKHIKKSSISISRPKIPIKREKSIRSFDLVKNTLNFEQEFALRSTEFSYVLKTDISRFYDTLYTHSISWALHGKNNAKKLRSDPRLYGNHLDRWVGRTRDGQTLGIPIGPDSSIIISEIIASSIDCKLKKKLGDNVHGIRIIDDYLLFFKERYECEDTLAILHGLFKKYELEMNPTKIKILELPYILEPQWKSEIRQFHFRTTPKKALMTRKVTIQKTDLINYFSRVNDYCRSVPDDNIMKYSMKRFHNEKIFKKSTPLFESLLLKSTLIQSSCISDIVEILKKYKTISYKNKNERINRTISELIRIHSKYSNDFEIAWALWLAKELDLEIDTNVYDILSKLDNPVVVLLILDLRDKGLIADTINETFWKKFLVKEQLYDDHWLFAYEALIKGWLTVSNDYIEEDPFFKLLKDENISFYESTRPGIPVISEPETYNPYFL